MAFITVTKGRREGEFAGPDGSYNVMLVEVADPVTETAKSGPNAGEEYTYITWTFAVDGGEFDGQVIDTRTSSASGPKSKMFGFLTALLGKVPTPGTELEKEQLVGRSAIAMIASNDGGYPIITGLMAVPQTRRPTTEAAPTPIAAARTRGATAVAEPPSDLPF